MSTERLPARITQRWRCSRCYRTFSIRTGTVHAGIHAPAKFASVLDDMLGPAPASCGELAHRLALDKTTIWQWRMKLGTAFAASLPGMPSRVLQFGETVLRESRKASRQWVDHERDRETYAKPDRWRWLDYRLCDISPPDQLPQFRIPVRFSLDRNGACHFKTGSAHAAGAQPPARDRPTATLPIVHRGETMRFDPAHHPQPNHPPATAPTPSERPHHLEPDPSGPPRRGSDPGGVLGGFLGFIRPFRGPATVHLTAYVAWFSIRSREQLTGSAQFKTLNDPQP